MSVGGDAAAPRAYRVVVRVAWSIVVIDAVALLLAIGEVLRWYGAWLEPEMWRLIAIGYGGLGLVTLAVLAGFAALADKSLRLEWSATKATGYLFVLAVGSFMHGGLLLGGMARLLE